MIEAHRRSPRFSASQTFDPIAGLPAADSRTPDQRRPDAFAEIVMAANSSKEALHLDGAPVTVAIIAAAVDLDRDDALDGDPVATMAGSQSSVSRAQFERFVDANGSAGSRSRSRARSWASVRSSGASRTPNGCRSPHGTATDVPDQGARVRTLRCKSIMSCRFETAARPRPTTASCSATGIINASTMVHGDIAWWEAFRRSEVQASRTGPALWPHIAQAA